MRTLTAPLAGEPVTVHVVETDDDARQALEFAVATPVLGLDTETTGLNPWAPDFALRLVQVGDARTAYVLRGDRDAATCRRIVTEARSLLIHNAGFDLQVVETALGVPLEQSFPRAWDTKTLARLADPAGVPRRRGAKLEATHGLKDLLRKHVDADLASDDDLHAAFRRYKDADGKRCTQTTGWSHIDIEDETYLRYAGLDPVLAVRLWHALAPEVDATVTSLMRYEMQIAYMLAVMRRAGNLVDEQVAADSKAAKREQWLAHHAVFSTFGIDHTAIDKHEDKARVAEILTRLGCEVGATPKGLPALSKDALEALTPTGEARVFYDAWQAARTLEKDVRDYIETPLRLRDAAGRVHPDILALGASTGRMSIRDPAMQQMPREGGVRGIFRADPGNVLVSCDFAQVEFRVAAALTGDQNMRQMIAEGVDLHAATASALYGETFTKEQRNIAKRAGFGRLYGGGRNAVATQTGVSLEVAEQMVAAFDRNFPRVIRYARQLSRQSEVVTRLGRRLPVDPERSYAAINYAIQGEARDVFVMAMLRLVEAGMLPSLWLPVHDEVVIQVPEADAQDAKHVLATVMADEFDGVAITAEAEVLGTHWRK